MRERTRERANWSITSQRVQGGDFFFGFFFSDLFFLFFLFFLGTVRGQNQRADNNGIMTVELFLGA